MRLKLALITALALLGCSDGPGNTGSPQTTPEADARQVLVDYRVPGMMGQVADIINDSLDTNLPGGATVKQADALKSVVSDVFAQDRLVGLAADYLQQRVEESDREDVLPRVHDKLSAELPQRMIALEDSAATDEFAEGFAAFLDQPVDPANEPRLDRLESLAASLHLVELQTEFSVGMMRAMIHARNAAASPNYEASQESLERMATQTRDGLNERLASQVPLLLFYAYRDVDDEALGQYQTLHGDEDMRWVNSQVPQAISAALAQTASEIGPAFEKRNSDG
ncbi:MAG: hypothetical protein CMN28_15005 [Salinisphaeraceae bacterium]|nr:hypothetical protein [Salinisphaeraceae bacterium]